MENKSSTYQDDRALVISAQKNSRAFAVIYDKYFERIYLFVFKRVQDQGAAGDICQDAMLKAMFNIKKYEDRGDSF